MLSDIHVAIYSYITTIYSLYLSSANPTYMRHPKLSTLCLQISKYLSYKATSKHNGELVMIKLDILFQDSQDISDSLSLNRDHKNCITASNNIFS